MIMQVPCYLATDLNVAASTQNQALNAIIFMYKHVLKNEIGDIGDVIRAKRPARLPVVLSVEESVLPARVRELRRLVLVRCSPIKEVNDGQETITGVSRGCA